MLLDALAGRTRNGYMRCFLLCVHEMLLVVCFSFCWSLSSLRSCSFCIAFSCFVLAQIMRNAGYLADAASPFARDCFVSLSFVCLCCESMFACAAFRLAGFFQDFDEQGKHFCRCPRSCMLMTARLFCEHLEFVLLFFSEMTAAFSGLAGSLITRLTDLPVVSEISDASSSSSCTRHLIYQCFCFARERLSMLLCVCFFSSCRTKLVRLVE